MRLFLFSVNEDLFQLGVKALITNSKGKILLLKINKDSLKDFSGEPYWDIPGGRVHRGSSIEETLVREVREETGITKIKNVKPFMMVLSSIRIPLSNTDTGLILSVYVCKAKEPITVTLSNEHKECAWFSPKEASELLKVKYPVDFTNKIVSLI